MSQKLSLPPLETTAEISALIETLVQTERRLAELTAGEVDTVADHQGRTFMLRRSQDALRDSDSFKKAAILNALPANIAVLDSHGVIVSVNDAWRSFGAANGLCSPDNCIGINYLDVCDVDSSESANESSQVAAGIRAVLSGRTQGFSVEYPCRSPLAQRWFLLTVTPLSDDHANGAVVMRVEVTAERQAVKSLETSESRFRQMAGHISDVFFLKDVATNRMLYMSPAYETITGRTSESTYAGADAWVEIIHPDDRALHLAQREQGNSSGNFEFEFRIVRPDGGIRWIEARSFPVFGDAGNITRIAGIAKDVTERKRVEEEQRVTRQLLDNIVENIPTAIQLKSVRDDFRIQMWNKAAEAMFGLPRDAAIGHNVQDLWPAADAVLMHAADLELVANGGMQDFPDRRAATKDGGTISVHMRKVALLDATGSVTHVLAVADDITEQKKAARALRESESRFREMADHITDVFFLQSLDGTELYYVSLGFERIWGRTRESLYANPMSWAEAIHPDDLQSELAKLSAGSKVGFENEFRIIRPDGKTRWIHGRQFVVLDAAGKPYRTAGVCTDITERKLATDELRSSEARFRSLTGLSSDWYWEQDEAYRFAAFTGGDGETGWGKDQFTRIGLCRWELPGVTPLSESWEQHKALLEARKPFRNFEYQRALGNGVFKYVSASGEPVFDANGRFTGYRGVATDITERKHAALELRESERRFRSLLENVQMASVMLDCEARITFCNAYLRNLTGWRNEEVIGRNWFEIFIPVEGGDIRQVFSALLADLPEAWHRENEIVTRSGERRLIRWNNSVLRSGTGEVIGTASIGEDITEYKRAEDEVRHLNASLEKKVEARTTELQAANKELEAFDYSVSHDLRAPIRHVEGFAALLMEHCGDKLDAQGRDYLQRIRDAGRRMEQLVGDLLALSLISRYDLHRNDVDLSALALKVFGDLQKVEPARQIECIVMPGLSANADRGLLQIVLENLVGNAWKFTGKRSGAKIEIGSDGTEAQQIFFVRDNGAGFDAEYAGRLFAPFQRLHKQSEFNGTGIGLATVRRIVTRHGGKVWAEGSVDKGATFRFTLPL